MKVQIFEQFMGGHYTNYIEHLLPTLIELKKSNLINEIIVTITSEHLESEYFEKQLKVYSQWVNFEPCLQYVDNSLGLDPRLILKNPKVFISSLQKRTQISNNLTNSVNRIKPDYLISTTADTQSSLRWSISSLLGVRCLPENTYAVGIFHYGYSGAVTNLTDQIKDFGYRLTWKYSPWSRLFVVNPLVYEKINFSYKSSKFSQRIKLVPDPVPPFKNIDKKTARHLFGIPEEGCYIGFIGSMDHRVAIPEMLNAFRSATSKPTDRLVLAGKIRPEYKKIIESEFELLLTEGRLIIMDRYLNLDEMNIGFCSLDIVSIMYYKQNNLSANLLKSIAMHRPVIVNKFGYTDMIVNRFNTGWSCNVLDHKDCVNTFEKALEECLNYSLNEKTKRLIEFHYPNNYAETILQDFLKITRPNLKPEVKTWESVLKD